MTEGLDLGSWLASRSVHELAEIIDRRPDSYWGAPLRGLDDLAVRLIQPSSVMSAISWLPLPAVEVLQALSALGSRPTVAGAAALLDAGARTSDEQDAAVHAAVALLEAGALAWRGLSAGGLSDRLPRNAVPAPGALIELNPGVRVVIDQPLGLGRTVAAHLAHTPTEQLRVLLRNLGLPDATRRADAAATLEQFLTDHRLVRELLIDGPESARRRMLTLARSGSEPPSHDRGDREGETWARGRGLIFGGRYCQPEVPVEVILAVRPGELTVRFDPDPPVLDTVCSDPSAVSDGAAAAATEFTETVAALLDLMTRSPLPTLKSGGVGTRELGRTAKALGLADGTVRFALELIRALGLLTTVGSGVGAGDQVGPWRADEPSARYADLAVTWWALPITASITHDSDGKAIPTIGGRSADGSALQLRWSVIEAVAALAPGTALAGTASLAESLCWQQPGDLAPDDPAITAVWTEAHAIGVLAAGALTPIGATLLEGNPEALLTVAGKLLPPATDVGRFGSDLTVMVAGSPSAAVCALLDSCADRESRGAAIVWRFSPTSVRRALDEGASAAELLAGLTAVATGDLPQTLTYLIGDVARRHGSLVVHPALCCVSSADEALLIEVAAHRSLRRLRPHLLAPTVIAFHGRPADVLDALRSAGYLPVAADEQGVVLLGRAGRGSAADVGDGDPENADPDIGDTEHGDTADEDPPTRMVDELRGLRSSTTGRSVDDPVALAAVRELAAALLSTVVRDGRLAVPGDRDREPTVADETVAAFGVQLDEVQRRQLAFAIDNQVPVSITYRSATGGTTTRTISDIELVNGLMYAWCHLRDDERVFAIDRVQAVVPVHR